MNHLVYDSGALIAAESGVERIWAIHQRALARGVQPLVPAPVLTEVWCGGRRATKLAEFVASCDIEPYTAAIAKAAGLLLATAPHGVADAAVTGSALRHRSACVTGNRAHIVELAHPHRIHIIDI
jgi:hypothetical protein